MENTICPWQNCYEACDLLKTPARKNNFPCLSVVDLSRNSSANFKLVRRSMLRFAFELSKIPDCCLGLHYSTQRGFSLKTSFSIRIEVQTRFRHQRLSKLSHVLRFVLSFIGFDKHSVVGIYRQGEETAEAGYTRASRNMHTVHKSNTS